jgi:hypothetical protein
LQVCKFNFDTHIVFAGEYLYLLIGLYLLSHISEYETFKCSVRGWDGSVGITRGWDGSVVITTGWDGSVGITRGWMTEEYEFECWQGRDAVVNGSLRPALRPAKPIVQ